MEPTPPPVPPEPEEIPEVLPVESPVESDALQVTRPLRRPALNDLTEDDDELVADDVAAPIVRPARPGPGFWMSLIWWLVMFVVQNIVVTAAIVLVIIVAIIQRGGAKELQEALNKNGPNVIFDLPGAIPATFLAGGATSILTAAAFLLILFRREAWRKVALRGVHPLHLGLVILMVPLTFLVASEIGTLAGKVLPHIQDNTPLYEKLGQQSWIVILLGGCLLPAAGEELFFRGFLSRGLVARNGFVLGTIFTAVLFGVMHMDPPQAVSVAVLAIALQITYVSSKSILAPILYHALNNGAAFCLMQFGNNETLNRLTSADDVTPLPPMLFVGALLALAATAWLFWECRLRWVLADGTTWSPGYVTAEIPPAQLLAVPKLSRPRTAAVLAAILAYALFAGELGWEIWKATRNGA
jgi:membrane protease YdiL (CAAX protease family)